MFYQYLLLNFSAFFLFSIISSSHCFLQFFSRLPVLCVYYWIPLVYILHAYGCTIFLAGGWIELKRSIFWAFDKRKNHKKRASETSWDKVSCLRWFHFFFPFLLRWWFPPCAVFWSLFFLFECFFLLCCFYSLFQLFFFSWLINFSCY